MTQSMRIFSRLTGLILCGFFVITPLYEGQAQLQSRIPEQNTCSEFTLNGPLTIPPIIPEDKFVPDFAIKGLSSADLSQPVMVINFFAASSSKYIAEHDVLLIMKKKYDVPIYGVAMFGNQYTLDAFLKAHGNPFIRAGVDTRANLSSAMNMEDLTQTLIVTKDRKVHWMYTGDLTQDIMESSMMPLIKELHASSGNVEMAP